MSRWPMVALVTVAQIGGRGINPQKFPDETFAHHSIPAFDNGELPATDLGASIKSQKTLVEPGMVLFSKLNPRIPRVWIVAAQPYRAVASTEFVPFVCDANRYDREFLAWRLRTLGEGALERFKSGAATKSRDRLTPRGLLDLRVPLPPLEEQRRIVDVLNRAAGIRRLREAALAKARDTIPALFLSMFGEPATNPMGWPFKSVADCGRVQLGRQRTPKYQTGKWSKPYMRVANVFEDRIDLSDVLEMDFDDRDHATYRLHVGDILLNEGQSLELVGRPAMWRGELADCCFQNTLVRFQATDSIVNPDFALAHFLWFFRAGAFSRIASKTSNVAHLGAGRFAAMEMFVPPLPLQQEFAARLGDLRGIIAQAERALTLARDTERALMAQLLG